MKIGIIGSGFSSLSAACCLAAEGHEVHIFEKNSSIGGRARRLTESGFTFDMGPSWYWMPDIFENFFNRFGKSTNDYYTLKRLDPGYRVVFGKNDYIDVPADFGELCNLFDSIEPGSSKKLIKFLDEAEYKYKVGIGDFVWRPSLSITEFLDLRIVKSLFALQMFSSISSEIRSKFKNEKLIKLLEFPVIFLGATPKNTPALYSLMNYADLKLGTWYPQGGMFKVVEGMSSLATELGVHFHLSHNVEKILVDNGLCKGLLVNGDKIYFDKVVAGSDYHHTEQNLLDSKYRLYSSEKWEKITMAPSSLLFYIGVKGEIPEFIHHILFFDRDFEKHAKEIYDQPKWPTEPLLYLSCTSKSDSTVAPPGHENLVVLIPLAPDLEDNEEIRSKYFGIFLSRMKEIYGLDLSDRIVYMKSYCINDFKSDYNAFKGNAYGLANTLLQTAFLKPKMKNKKVKNLYFTGQLTVPGPGVPPTIISGQVVADLILSETI